MRENGTQYGRPLPPRPPNFSRLDVATKFKDDDLTEAERKLQSLRRMLRELHAAIRDAEKLIEDAERRRSVW
jgi:hypothetical protein